MALVRRRRELVQARVLLGRQEILATPSCSSASGHGCKST